MTWFKRFKINRAVKKLKSMQHFRNLNQPSDEILKKEIAGYFQLAAWYEALQGNKKFPFAREQALVCFRAAAMLDDMEAQYQLGKRLLDEAKCREILQQSEVFASESNASDVKRLYKEAHAFLTSATEYKHIAAKRLLGLCYINGWGVDVDKNHGFDLVISSIEQENSWDKVQKIFAEIGINESKFFSELFQHRNKS